MDAGWSSTFSSLHLIEEILQECRDSEKQKKDKRAWDTFNKWMQKLKN